MTSLLQEERGKGTFKTPLFYVFKLFPNNCHGKSIDTYVQCDTFNTEKYKCIPYLDVTTVYNERENTVIINVVNRHKEEVTSADIVPISGLFVEKARVTVVNQGLLEEPFTFEKKESYIPEEKEVTVNSGNKISFTFPPHLHKWN